MYVALVPNRNSPPAYLLREGYREDGKVKSRTLANLSHWPRAKIERLRRVLRDEVLGGAAEGLTMLRSLPHGHVAACLDPRLGDHAAIADQDDVVEVETLLELGDLGRQCRQDRSRGRCGAQSA